MEDGLPLRFCILPARSTNPFDNSRVNRAVTVTGLVPAWWAMSVLVGDFRKNMD